MLSVTFKDTKISSAELKGKVDSGGSAEQLLDEIEYALVP